MTKIEMVRLIADEGKMLTDGTITGTVIDTFAKDIEKWSEIDSVDETGEKKSNTQEASE